MPRLPGLSPLPPAPDGGGLTLHVLCSTTADFTSTTRHTVELAPDWSVTTPHDMAAERVAAAFGGYLSCLHLADRVVPAVRAALQLNARRGVPRMKRAMKGTWRAVPSSAGRCCRAVPTAGQAAAHLRGVEHVAARVGGHVTLTATVLEQVLATHREAGSFRLPPDSAELLRRCVSGTSGGVAIWEAGLHPQVVAAIHDEVVGPDGPPLPEALYLGVVSRRPDLAWMADTVAAAARAVGAPITRYDTGHLAEWLAWTQTPLDRKQRQVRAGWLATGVPRTCIEVLSDAGYSPVDAQRLATGTRRSVPGAAGLLADWVGAGCRPSVDALLSLYADGVPPWQAPSKQLIAWLRSHLGDLAQRYTTTDLGLMLVREGSVPATAALVLAEAGLLRRRDCA